MAMTFDEHLIALREQADLFAAAVAKAPRDVVVPSCPDWTIVDLADHLGNVWCYWTEAVRAADCSSAPEVADSPPPEGGELDWLRPLAPALEAALRTVGPASPCWTWWGEPATAGAVARHQMQETAMHRYDAERAAGQANPLPCNVALDSIEEFLAISVGAGDLSWPGAPAVITLAPTDSALRFSLRLDATVARIETPPDTPPDIPPPVAGATAGSVQTDVGNAPAVTVAGTASELILALYRRLAVTDLQVTGDSAVANAFFALTPND